MAKSNSNATRIIFVSIMLLIVFIAFLALGYAVTVKQATSFGLTYLPFAIITVIGVALAIAKLPIVKDIFWVFEGSNIAKAVVGIIACCVLAFLILIINLTTNSVVVPVPTNALGIFDGALGNLFTTSAIPALFEDFPFFVILPGILSLPALLLVDRFKIKFLRQFPFLIFIPVALISAFSFAGYHAFVYGENAPFYFMAFGFGFIQSMIYLTTRVYFPIAHFTNNTLATVRQTFDVLFVISS